MENFVDIAANATELDSAFFEQNIEQHPGSVFGYPNSLDDSEDDSKRFSGWYRTTSGRAATVILEAEDAQEVVGLLQFTTGESEVRRSQSFRPCLFGPASDDSEEFDSDVDEDDLASEVDTETDSEGVDNSEDESDDLPDSLGDVLPELPTISQVHYRRNRGCSWYKMNSLGEVFETDNSSGEKKTKSRMTMDAFGNFVVAGTENQQDLYLEHLKMVQKRHPGGNHNMKRSPTVSAMILQASDSNLLE